MKKRTLIKIEGGYKKNERRRILKKGEKKILQGKWKQNRGGGIR